jgi:hypothetical protein
MKFLLRPIDPEIVLLREVRDYDACARLDEANRKVIGF